MRDAQEAASRLGVQLQILQAGTEGEIDTAFATLASLHADALIIGGDAFFTSQREHLVALAARYAVPVIDRWREFVVAGGLISYGPSLTSAYRLAGA
jgi:putative tryptophan/tyrosine transport system substrate-binding protein